MDEFLEDCPVGGVLEAAVAGGLPLFRGASPAAVETLQAEGRRKLRGLLNADVAGEMYASVAVLLHEAAMERLSTAGRYAALRGGIKGEEAKDGVVFARCMDAMLRGVFRTRAAGRAARDVDPSRGRGGA